MDERSSLIDVVKFLRSPDVNIFNRTIKNHIEQELLSNPVCFALRYNVIINEKEILLLGEEAKGIMMSEIQLPKCISSSGTNRVFDSAYGLNNPSKKK
jgi:hypothetical protein